MKKLLSFIFFIILLFFIFTGTKQIFVGAKSFFSKYKEEIVEEDMSNIAIQKKKIEKKKKVEGIMVPRYWKNGVQAEENDYLKGYVPSIREFQKYISIKDNILYGSVEGVEMFPDRKHLLSVLTKANTIFVEGMANENSYFDWSDENCSVFENGFEGEKIFVCDNWVNWMKRKIDEPFFVLTDCRIGNEIGKCVFLDYTNVYFLEKKIEETRCMSKEYAEVCKVENYREKIRYK
jgi:hypothetical protein